MQTGILLLKDVSSSGTWIEDDSAQGYKLLHHATWPLLKPIQLRFGRENRYMFHVVPTDYMADMGAFSQTFQDYARSTNYPSPSFVKDLRTISTPVRTIAERYVALHSVGQEPQQTATCLRTYDGKVYAVKILSNGLSAMTRQRRSSDHRGLRAQASHLRSIRHVSIRFHRRSRKDHTN